MKIELFDLDANKPVQVSKQKRFPKIELKDKDFGEYIFVSARYYPNLDRMIINVYQKNVEVK